MNWSATLDFYCERVAPGLWGEPLNAISNGAFWLAALWLWWRSLRLRRPARQTPSARTAPLWHWELDLPLCSQWRWGTHFAWHLLNALTLGLTAYALLQTQRDKTG